MHSSVRSVSHHAREHRDARHAVLRKRIDDRIVERSLMPRIALADEDQEDTSDQLARLELYEKMRAAIGKLSKSDQEIINAYYFEEKSLEEVGKRLGLSKSWTCRKHARAMEKLSDVFFAMIKDPEFKSCDKRNRPGIIAE